MFPGMKTSRSASVIGRPGAGLDAAGWAASGTVAATGREGELKTGSVLDRLASSHGPVVLHDLRIPAPGARANIDHAVVAGRAVWLIDSKHWAPGFVWGRARARHGRIGGRAVTWGVRRGAEPFPAAAKLAGTWNPGRVAAVVSEYLAEQAAAVGTVRSLIVAWPTRYDARLSLWALSVPHARVIHGERFARVAGRTIGTDRAEPVIVRALARLVTGQHPDGQHRPDQR